MRTKNCKQIYQQEERIFSAIAHSHWDGKKYLRYSEMIERIEKIEKIRERYISNIYNYHTNDRKGLSTEESNRIFHIQTPVSIYAKK